MICSFRRENIEKYDNYRAHASTMRVALNIRIFDCFNTAQ